MAMLSNCNGCRRSSDEPKRTMNRRRQERGNLNSQIPAPQENVWLRSILRDENFFVSHAKLTIFKVSPTLSNLTKLRSMCIPSHYAALFAATGEPRRPPKMMYPALSDAKCSGLHLKPLDAASGQVLAPYHLVAAMVINVVVPCNEPTKHNF